MLSSCALEPTANQVHTGWIRLLAEDDASHPLGISGQRIEVIVVSGGFSMIEKFEMTIYTNPAAASRPILFRSVNAKSEGQCEIYVHIVNHLPVNSRSGAKKK